MYIKHYKILKKKDPLNALTPAPDIDRNVSRRSECSLCIS